MEICSLDCDKPVKCRGWCEMHYARWKRTGSTDKTAKKSPARDWLDAHMSVKVHGDECVLWPFATNRKDDGYGVIGRPSEYVHRVVCEQFHGAPNGLECAHSCGIRLCCNPNHLRWATRKENMADAVIHGTASVGEKQPGSKLTDAKVLEIRNLAKGGRSLTSLANDAEVSVALISRVVNGIVWKHVGGPIRKVGWE